MQRPWVWLFGFETFGRIAAGSAIAMYSHCNACDDKNQRKRLDEIPPSGGSPVSKLCQPMFHEPPLKGHGNGVCYQDLP